MLRACECMCCWGMQVYARRIATACHVDPFWGQHGPLESLGGCLCESVVKDQCRSWQCSFHPTLSPFVTFVVLCLFGFFVIGSRLPRQASGSEHRRQGRCCAARRRLRGGCGLCAARLRTEPRLPIVALVPDRDQRHWYDYWTSSGCSRLTLLHWLQSDFWKHSETFRNIQKHLKTFHKILIGAFGAVPVQPVPLQNKLLGLLGLFGLLFFLFRGRRPKLIVVENSWPSWRN